MVLILVAKEIAWLQPLLIELGLLLPTDQYTKIKIIEGSRGVKKIKVNLKDQKEKNDGMVSKATSIHPSNYLNTLLYLIQSHLTQR